MARKYTKVEQATGCDARWRRRKDLQGYAFCNRLFEPERQFEPLTAEERLRQRKEKTAPVLEAYWKWLGTFPCPTGKLKDAITYSLSAQSRVRTLRLMICSPGQKK